MLCISHFRHEKNQARENQKEASNKISGEIPQRTSLCFHVEEALVQTGLSWRQVLLGTPKVTVSCMITAITSALSLTKTPQ